MLNPDFLTIATLVLAGVLVAALVVYLSGVLIALRRAGTHLQGVVQALAEVESNTGPLQEKVETINGALDQLGDGLASVDGRLASIAKVFGL